MSLTILIMLSVIALVVMLLLPPKPKLSTGVGSPLVVANRSFRDLEIDEDLEAVSEAYRQSEREARKKAAIAKIASLSK